MPTDPTNDEAEFDRGLGVSGSPAVAPNPSDEAEFDKGLNPSPPTAPQSWAQYAGDPSHPLLARVGSAMVEEGRRFGSGIANAITGLPGLAHRVGQETANNTATPETAGQVANLAAMTTPGDMIAPGLPGIFAERTAVQTPSAMELKGAGGGGLDALRGLGVHYDLDYTTPLIADEKDALSALGRSDVTAPKTHAVLSRLGSPSSEDISLPLTGLAEARQVLGQIRQGNDPSERFAANHAISFIDNFIQNAPEEAVLAGPASQAGDILREANANYAAGKRSDKINAAGEYASFKAAGANSGANYDNNLRQRLRPLFDPSKPQRLSGFTDAEKQGVENVINGSLPRNTLRSVSSLMGGGGGSVAGMEGIGAAYAGYEHAGIPGALAGAGIPVVGRGLRAVQNGLAKSALNKVDETIRQRSPLYQQRAESAPIDLQTSPDLIATTRALGADNLRPDQQQRASGGSVKPSHEQLLARFMTAVEKAKKAEKERTKPLLSVPDDTVAKALAVAQRAI